MKGLSDTSLKVIYIFVAILVLAGAYMFGISKNIAKHTELAEQNIALDKTVRELIEKNAQVPAVKEEIAAMDAEIVTICNRFPSRLTEQKVYYILDDLIKATDIEANSIAISLNNLFYSNGVSLEGELGNNVKDDGYDDELEELVAGAEGAEGGAAVSDEAAVADTETDETEPEEAVADYNNLSAYETTVNIPFSGEYDAVKNMITYITNHADHMSVGPLSASFDSATGLISGSLVINMYALYNNGKPYVEPEINGIDMEVTNIFGSYKKK